MSVYDKNGRALNTIYNKDGTSISSAYDINGNIVFSRDTTIKVATYNVGQWYLGNHDNVPVNLDSTYYALQNGMISSINADILLLEEYTKQFSKLPRTAISMLEQYYPYIHEQGGDNPTASTSVGRCVCSKYPITNYTTHTYTQGSPFYFDSCNITIGDNVFMVIVTHLHWASGLTDSIREQEIAELINFASDYSNVIIGGDFNTALSTSLTEAQYQYAYNAFVKPFIDAGFNSANFKDFGNMVTCIDGSNVEYLLDTIYTSPNISITNAYVDTTKETDQIVEKIDHMPLVATIEL